MARFWDMPQNTDALRQSTSKIRLRCAAVGGKPSFTQSRQLSLPISSNAEVEAQS